MSTSTNNPPPMPMPMSPRKDSSGDPLFDAALRSHGQRSLDEICTNFSCSSPTSTMTATTAIILTEHQPRRPSDPNFDGLTGSSFSSSSGASVAPPPAMHTYYNEFRLGHGDPLIKAAMKRWPCATTDYSLPECPDSPRIHNERKQRLMKKMPQGSPVSVSCRTLSESVPRDIVNVPGGPAWPFVDIVELDHLHLEQAMVKERRFVMVDEHGRTVAEAEDDVEEMYSDFQQGQ